MDVCNVLPVVAQMLVKTVHSVAYVRYDVHTQNADIFFFSRPIEIFVRASCQNFRSCY